MNKRAEKKTLVILIGSYYLREDELHILKDYYKKNICVANEQYEKKLLDGFLSLQSDVVFVSAPRVGNFPISSKKMLVNGFTENEHLKTVRYLSIYGFANFFKTKALIRKIKKIIKKSGDFDNFHLIACEAHHPYLEAIKYFNKKLKTKTTFSTLIVPDLPSDMKKHKNFIYSFFKKLDVLKIQSICDRFVDSFLCFTAPINSKINRRLKKSIIYEGIIEKSIPTVKKSDEIKHIVFVGKVDERNGIKLILEAAKLSPQTFIYDIYGSGNMENYLDSIKIENVNFHGFLEPSKIDSVINEADVMVSPRFPDAEYTKYSFPSKIFEYLGHEKKIVTYKLPCYFEELDDFLIYPKDFSPEELLQAIIYAIQHQNLKPEKYEKLFSKYSSKHIAQEIICLRKNKL